MHGLLTADYDFDLPPDLIAQAPLARRDASRLMVVNRQAETIEPPAFPDLPSLPAPGDLPVVNRSRVVKARLLGTRIGSGAPAEIFLLQPLGDGRYEAMVSPGGKLKPGRTVQFAAGFTGEILEATERRTRIVPLRTAAPFSDVDQAIDAHGHTPLPPYITRPNASADLNASQTAYNREAGAERARPPAV